MRALGAVLALVVAACTGCNPPAMVISVPSSPAVGVRVGIQHTVFLDYLGCTGVSMGKGMVATAKHCVEDKEVGTETRDGTLAWVHDSKDIALLFVANRVTDISPVYREARLGEHLYAIGYPVQLPTRTQELTVTDGVFAGPLNDDGEGRFTAPIYYGNSGGGVWSDEGALLGFSVNGFLQVPGMNYMVMVTDLLEP